MALVVNTCRQFRRPERYGPIPGSRRFPRGGHGNPLQYSYLENPMDKRTWWAVVHRVIKSKTQLKQFSTHTCIHSEYKSDIKYMPEKYYFQSAYFFFHFLNNVFNRASFKIWYLIYHFLVQRVKICLQCRKQKFNAGLGISPGKGNGSPLQYSCQGNSHGQKSLAGYSPQGCKKLDTTEQLTLSLFNYELFFWFHLCNLQLM